VRKMDNYEKNRAVTAGQLIKILRGLGLLTSGRDEEWILQILQEPEKIEKSAHFPSRIRDER